MVVFAGRPQKVAVITTGFHCIKEYNRLYNRLVNLYSFHVFLRKK